MSLISNKAQQIKLIIFDVDGVLTSGIIYYGNQDIELKGFHIQDGLGIKLLKKTKVEIGIITAKESAAVSRRIKDLDITYYYPGYVNKLPAYLDIKNKLQLSDQQIAYMGDDLPDLPILKRVGLSISVPDAPEIVKSSVDLITSKKGGQGAVREVCEHIMRAQNTYDEIIGSYFQ